MPTIEIMSPLSETSVSATFVVDGEDDLPREVKKGPKGIEVVTAGTYEIRLSYRQSGATNYTDWSPYATFLGDGTWTCEMTLTAGHNYDIKATLWHNGAATSETDQVYTVQVSAAPLITIDPPPLPPPGPGVPVVAAPAAPAREFTGTSQPTLAGTVGCALLRLSRKRGLILPVAKYHNTGRVPSSGDWFVNPPPKRIRPRGNRKTLVLLAFIEDANGEAVAATSRVIRKS